MPHIGLSSASANLARWTMLRITTLRPLRLVALPLALGFALAPGPRAAAQSGDIQVVIPSLIEVASATESPLTIRVTPGSAVPRRAMVLIRGLPSTIALSHGRVFESGVWGIPVAEIGDLQIASPTGAIGRTDFSVSLVTLAGDVLAEAKSSLVIGQPAAVAAPPPPRPPAETNTAFFAPAQEPAPEPEPDAPLVKAPPTGEALDRVLLFMQKGDESMRVGNLNVARLFYKRAADEGWGEGAMALGATYDPVELGRMQIAGGIQPDPAQARMWYELAAKMGSKLAETRLQRLSQR